MSNQRQKSQARELGSTFKYTGAKGTISQD